MAKADVGIKTKAQISVRSKDGGKKKKNRDLSPKMQKSKSETKSKLNIFNKNKIIP